MYILHDTTNDQIKSFQGEIQGESHTVSVKKIYNVYVAMHLIICNTDRPYDTLPTLVPLE